MPEQVAEHGDVITVAVSQADGFAEPTNGTQVVAAVLDEAWPEFPEPDEDEMPEPILLDHHKNYDDARLMWRPQMVRVLKGGLIFYNGQYPLAEVLLNVYNYLSTQTAATAPQEAK